MEIILSIIVAIVGAISGAFLGLFLFAGASLEDLWEFAKDLVRGRWF